jgi:hypothetical protein
LLKKLGERKMRNVSFFVILVFSLTVVALASIMVEPAAAEDPIIVGKWDRTDGDDKYTIYADGTTQTVLPDGTHHGTWEMDDSSGYKYVFRWDFGPSGRENFIDYVTVAADGQSYSGVNNYGNQFHCVRVGGADSTPAADSGFPVIPVAVGGGIAAIAVGGAAAYYFLIAKHGAETAAIGANAAGGSGSVINEEQNPFLPGSREVAEATKDAVSKPQSSVTENRQYLSQEKNSDLSASEKHNTKSKAQNQPAKDDQNNYGMGLGSENKVEQATQVDSDKGGG